MRRIAQTLAVTGAVLGMGLTALPAGASTLGSSDVVGKARAAHASPTPAQRQAAARAARLLSLRGQRGAITGIVRGRNGAPEASVCVVASGPLATRKAFTRPDGRFIIAGLPRGAYRVEYRGCSPIGRFVGQWYGGLTRESAAKVMVAGHLAGRTRTGHARNDLPALRARGGVSAAPQPGAARRQAGPQARIRAGGAGASAGRQCRAHLRPGNQPGRAPARR